MRTARLLADREGATHQYTADQADSRETWRVIAPREVHAEQRESGRGVRARETPRAR
jgi:hypothetical protein